MALYRVFGETLTVVASSSTVNALSFVSIISIMLMKGNTQIPSRPELLSKECRLDELHEQMWWGHDRRGAFDYPVPPPGIPGHITNRDLELHQFPLGWPV